MALLLVLVVASGCGAADESTPVAVGPAPSAASAVPVAPQPVSAAPIAAQPTDQFAGQPLIERTEWTDDPDGRRLRVYPSTAGRGDWFAPALDRAWGEVLDRSPDADSPGMYDQFKCHWQWARLVAPAKPSWNLEPWRPAFGYEATVAAGCNPGGPDPAGN